MTLYCFKEKQDCCEALAVKIRDVSRRAISLKDSFSLVLSGGSSPRHLYRMLASSQWRDKIEWRKAQIFFGDERCVSPESTDSNYKMARDSMLKELPIPEYQIYRIHGESPADTEAVRYQAVIEAYFRKVMPGEPLFDLTLLGLGSDGHTASLFPGDPALSHTGLVTPVTVPSMMKPAVKRVSLTLTCLAMSKNICFLVHGADKAGITKGVLEKSTSEYPAALIQSKKLYWFLSGMDCRDWQDRF